MTKAHNGADALKKYYSVGEAAEYLGVSPDTLKRWESKGMITPSRTPTNHRRYTVDQLDDVIEQYRQL